MGGCGGPTDSLSAGRRLKSYAKNPFGHQTKSSPKETGGAAAPPACNGFYIVFLKRLRIASLKNDHVCALAFGAAPVVTDDIDIFDPYLVFRVGAET